MATEPDDTYPESWTPPHVKATERERTQRADDAATYIGTLNDQQLDELITRVRARNNDNGDTQ